MTTLFCHSFFSFQVIFVSTYYVVSFLSIWRHHQFLEEHCERRVRAWGSLLALSGMFSNARFYVYALKKKNPVTLSLYCQLVNISSWSQLVNPISCTLLPHCRDDILHTSCLLLDMCFRYTLRHSLQCPSLFCLLPPSLLTLLYPQVFPTGSNMLQNHFPKQ